MLSDPVHELNLASTLDRAVSRALQLASLESLLAVRCFARTPDPSAF